MIVLKYELQRSGLSVVKIPRWSKTISVGNQFGNLVVWVEGTPNKPVARKFYSALTGEPIADCPGEFLGTVQFNGGEFVVHVYDCGEA